LYINVVSYFYASVNWLLYINYRGPLGQSQIHNTRITDSPLAYSSYTGRLQHATLKTLTKSKEIKYDSMVNVQVLCPW